MYNTHSNGDNGVGVEDSDGANGRLGGFEEVAHDDVYFSRRIKWNATAYIKIADLSDVSHRDSLTFGFYALRGWALFFMALVLRNYIHGGREFIKLKKIAELRLNTFPYSFRIRFFSGS